MSSISAANSSYIFAAEKSSGKTQEEIAKAKQERERVRIAKTSASDKKRVKIGERQLGPGFLERYGKQ